MKTKEIYAERRFLNKGSYHSIAAVCGTLDKDIEEDNKWAPFNTDFYISNCDRAISLDIDCSTEEDFDNSIYKLRQIEEVCRGLKEALIEQKPVLIEWIKNKKEQK